MEAGASARPDGRLPQRACSQGPNAGRRVRKTGRRHHAAGTGPPEESCLSVTGYLLLVTSEAACKLDRPCESQVTDRVTKLTSSQVTSHQVTSNQRRPHAPADPIRPMDSRPRDRRDHDGREPSLAVTWPAWADIWHIATTGRRGRSRPARPPGGRRGCCGPAGSGSATAGPPSPRSGPIIVAVRLGDEMRSGSPTEFNRSGISGRCWLCWVAWCRCSENMQSSGSSLSMAVLMFSCSRSRGRSASAWPCRCKIGPPTSNNDFLRSSAPT